MRSGVHMGWVKVVSDSAGGRWPGLGAVYELQTRIRICRHCLGTTKSFLKCAKDFLSAWNFVA